MKFKLVESLLEDLVSNRRALLKKFNNDEIIVHDILHMDPSVSFTTNDMNDTGKGEGKYLLWLGKIFAQNGNKFHDTVKLKNALTYFYKQSKQFENKDIFQFKTEEDLINKVIEVSAYEKSNFEIKIDNLEKNMDIDNLPYPDFDIKKAKEGINLVYHDSKWLVYVPENYEASVVLRGQNAEWCTGWHEKHKRMDDKYNEYTEDGSKLYIIINKQNPDEKYQVCIHPNGSWQEFNDAKNDSLEIGDLKLFFDRNIGLCNFFGKLTNYNLCAPKEIREKEWIYDGIHKVPTWVEKVIIKDGVTEIKKAAFWNCKFIPEITIPESVTKIGKWAFYNCESLIKLNFKGNNLTEIGCNAFCRCTSLSEITIPESVTKIENNVFSNCTSLNKVIFKGNNLTKIEEGTFSECESLQEITIPESITEIGSWTFADCKSLQEITIPESVVIISDYAFNNCSKNLIIKSNSKYVKNYCKENNINCEKLN